MADASAVKLDFVRKGMCRMSSSATVPWVDLCSVGLSKMELSDKIENKVRMYTTKLTCHLLEECQVGNRKLVFLAVTVLGKEFLVGTSDRPYPIVTQKRMMPDAPSGVSDTEMTVTFTSTHPALTVI
ncbi:MAG: hypothetical protein IKJ42_10905 [Bacteroidaceae bacterium]|nr:hypothetical protein [Bacteroidaceae bacterium]